MARGGHRRVGHRQGCHAARGFNACAKVQCWAAGGPTGNGICATPGCAPWHLVEGLHWTLTLLCAVNSSLDEWSPHPRCFLDGAVTHDMAVTRSRRLKRGRTWWTRCARCAGRTVASEAHGCRRFNPWSTSTSASHDLRCLELLSQRAQADIWLGVDPFRVGRWSAPDPAAHLIGSRGCLQAGAH